jgi:diguanylate cyclase (GGDEF)-like protein
MRLIRLFERFLGLCLRVRYVGAACLLSAVFLWLGAAPSAAQTTATSHLASNPIVDATFPTFEITATGPGRIDVGPHMGVLIDSSHTMNAQDVMQPAAQWQSIDRRSPNFGFSPDAYWFRFQISNPQPQTATRYIEMPISFMDHIYLAHHAGGTLLQEYESGDELPFAVRPVVHQNFVFPVQLQPGRNDFRLRLVNAGTIEAPLRIWEPAAFQVANQREKLAQGMVIGTLMVMVLYNLFVYFGTRDRNYLYYIGFALSYLFFQYSLTGYAYAYVWPEATWWNSVAVPMFICTTEMTVAMFCHSFLRVKGYSPWAHNVLRALILGTGCMALLSLFLPYSVAIRIGAGLAIPTASFCLGLGYWRWWQGDSFARLFCVAWTSALIGVMVLTAGKFGIIPSNFWTENAGQIGILGLVVLLSFTLVDRINHDRSGRIAAQTEALEHERAARASQEALIAAKEEANRKLEQRVQERTEDLNSTLLQLQQANAQLQRLSMTDGLTQVSNRASFDIAFVDEFKRAVRHKTHISLMLIDVDHFKRVNDTWGHLAGDACLQAFARLLQPRVHRAGDMLARYGGEEFVMILGETVAADAQRLAESFRAAIENLAVNYEGHTLRFTASIGVACVVPSGQISPQELLAAADKALYQAKQNGRNRVCMADF